MLEAKQPGPFYQIGLFLVTGAMVLLPLVYLALIFGAGWGVYHFAVYEFPAIWEWRIGGRYGLLVQTLCSVTPLLAGLAIVLAMVKPIFSPQGRRMHPIALNPEAEPAIYQLIQDVCGLVGAPTPKRIAIDCSVNASAGFVPGPRGFFGNQLILTIGLPLVAGLTQREFAGVLAHEFGHFRQGFGMRLSYIIRRINAWFVRLIYERDAFDDALESWAETDNIWVQIGVGVVRLGVWFSRRILWCLMLLGHAICSFLLREMEYDADRFEIQLAGSAAFESTSLKLAELSFLEAALHRDMQHPSGRLHLPDNLPILLEYHSHQLPEETRQKIRLVAGSDKTSWLDTHPSATDRVRRARKLNLAGYEIPDEPATQLFDYFESLGKMVTLAHYEDDLEVEVRPEYLIPVERLMHQVCDGSEERSSSAVESVQPKVIPMMQFDPDALAALKQNSSLKPEESQNSLNVAK